jgi:3-oxoacyl-[acyl-carrier-protein] synthase-3
VALRSCFFSMMRSVIIGTGSYVPDQIVNNKVFENNQFYQADGSKLYKKNQGIIARFSEITGINERRYATAEQNCSDLALFCAESAISSSRIDRETLEYIIVAHNFGDVSSQSNRISQVPTLASRVKAMLGIQNPDCVAYDLLFGCPGWIQGVIQADCFIRSGMAKRCLIIGCETLSRVIDPHDRDSMIYADGSGAIILEGSSSIASGILSHKTRTYANDSNLLRMDSSYSDFTNDQNDRFLKMDGRKVYEFALRNVPLVMKDVIEKAGLHLTDIKKVLVHQANDKMDRAILQRLFKLYHEEIVPDNLMPMTIGWLGNSSVATVPTLLDLVCRGRLVGHEINPGDYILMASVGAGMNVNAILYRC